MEVSTGNHETEEGERPDDTDENRSTALNLTSRCLNRGMRIEAINDIFGRCPTYADIIQELRAKLGERNPG